MKKLKNKENVSDNAEKELRISDVSGSKIIYPSPKEIENILNNWDSRDDSCWDYQSNRDNVKTALLEYRQLIIEKNK